MAKRTYTAIFKTNLWHFIGIHLNTLKKILCNTGHEIYGKESNISDIVIKKDRTKIYYN